MLFLFTFGYCLINTEKMKAIESRIVKVKDQEINFRTGFLYVDHFGRKVSLKEFNDDSNKKPLIAFCWATMKTCYYHFSQLTPYTE